MKYPIVSLSYCEEFAGKKIKGQSPTIEETWKGRGEAIDLTPIEQFSSNVTKKISQLPDSVDRDQVEGEVAIKLYHLLEPLPTQVLDDPGFWRYLSIKYFWDFVAWREKEPFDKGNYLKYLGGSNSTEAVLPRMYLRAKSVGSGHSYLAGELEKSADFWRSHVLRVRTGSAPALTRALVRTHIHDRLMTGTLREFARGLNRTWSNIQLHLYDEEEATQLVKEVRRKVE
jgi:hypothetical protein